MKDILIQHQLHNVLYVKTQHIILKKIHPSVMNVQYMKEQKVAFKIL
jgi:phenolic acid decarboxylase